MGKHTVGSPAEPDRAIVADADPQLPIFNAERKCTDNPAMWGASSEALGRTGNLLPECNAGVAEYEAAAFFLPSDCFTIRLKGPGKSA